tara:strand:- start:5721 stop:6875 length:1155 start_codon:yes stop_codon:yes gene_type:complete
MHVDFPFKVYLVDNAGTVEKDFDFGDKNIEVIVPGKNLGWMAAHNLALETVKEEFYCLLNDDVVFLPGHNMFFRRLVSHLHDAKVGAVGPGSNFVAGIQSLMALNTPPICNVDMLIGFCMVLRTSVLKDVGGLDHTLPGGDDLDLSMRLQDKGYILRVDRTCYLHHFGQQTGTRVKGADWDSSWSQEVTNNALIMKHGFKQWVKIMRVAWYPLEFEEEKFLNENKWYKEKLLGFQGNVGLNIGCGGTRYEGVVNVDERAKGSKGAGGERDKDCDPDIVASAHDIPLGDSSQGFILAGHLFEHLVNPVETLREWHRLLKPNGHLLMTVPDHTYHPTMALDITHVHAYTPASLIDLLVLCGFSVHLSETRASGVIYVEAISLKESI